MNEKRYEIRTNINGEHWLFDNKYDKAMMISKIRATLSDVCNRLNKQQATISQLQDLCGKSDGENAKLRIENKRLCDEIKLLKPTNIEQYEQIVQLQEENEKLRKQIQNYEKLIANSYVGEEETLDGFLGKYVIWEDELQKYKNKNEMIDNE